MGLMNQKPHNRTTERNLSDDNDDDDDYWRLVTNDDIRLFYARSYTNKGRRRTYLPLLRELWSFAIGE